MDFGYRWMKVAKDLVNNAKTMFAGGVSTYIFFFDNKRLVRNGFKFGLKIARISPEA